jgi:uncharacterized membrane protein YfcA
VPITWLAVAAAFLFASFIKGTTGMGFPLIATPMLALVLDIRTTYALLLLPNMRTGLERNAPPTDRPCVRAGASGR